MTVLEVEESLEAIEGGIVNSKIVAKVKIRKFEFERYMAGTPSGDIRWRCPRMRPCNYPDIWSGGRRSRIPLGSADQVNSAIFRSPTIEGQHTLQGLGKSTVASASDSKRFLPTNLDVYRVLLDAPGRAKRVWGCAEIGLKIKRIRRRNGQDTMFVRP